MKKTYVFIEDMTGVMERLGGSEILLDRMLIKYRDAYKDTRSRLMQLLEQSETEEAWRLVHTIKGVSVNLGISSVYRNAVLLEAGMKEHRQDGIARELSVFLDDLDSVMEILSKMPG